ncbi:MAG: hypothetical protein RXO54_08395 [Acidilobus sp.]
MSSTFSGGETNKKMAQDLRQLLAELKRLTRGKLEIINAEDNYVKLYAKLSEEQFEELKDWLGSKRYIDANGAVNRIADYIDYKEDLVNEEWAKVDNEYRYTGDEIWLTYHDISAPDGRYIILKEIAFYRNKERAEE